MTPDEWRSWARAAVIAIGVFALFGMGALVLTAWQLTIVRRDVSDSRAAITALTVRMDGLDAHGTQALREHQSEMTAHSTAR